MPTSGGQRTEGGSKSSSRRWEASDSGLDATDRRDTDVALSRDCLSHTVQCDSHDLPGLVVVGPLGFG